MVSLTNAVLARAIGLDAITKQIQAVHQPLTGDTVMVQSFPWQTTVILGCWAAGTPGDTFSWTIAIAGGTGGALRIGPKSGTIRSSGELSWSTQVPLRMEGPGLLSIELAFDGSAVWARPLIVHAAGSQSPTIQ